jgi:hypothetical protein
VAKSCEHGNEPSGSIVLENSSVAVQLAASQEGLSSMEIVRKHVCIFNASHNIFAWKVDNTALIAIEFVIITMLATWPTMDKQKFSHSLVENLTCTLNPNDSLSTKLRHFKNHTFDGH